MGKGISADLEDVSRGHPPSDMILRQRAEVVSESPMEMACTVSSLTGHSAGGIQAHHLEWRQVKM